MAEIVRCTNEISLGNIQEELLRSHEIETAFNRVLASLFAWSGVGDYGRELLRLLWSRAYRSECPHFDEMYREYPLPTETDKLVWPDFALRSKDTLWMIETKTRAGSIRKGQLEEQVHYASSVAKGRSVMLLAVGPSRGIFSCPQNLAEESYAELTWKDVASAVRGATEAVRSPMGRERCLAFAEEAGKLAGGGGRIVRGSQVPERASLVGRTWKPGLEGVMALPDSLEHRRGRTRPFFVVSIDSAGSCAVLDGPFTWETARGEARILAQSRNLPVFATPEGRRLRELHEGGFLKLRGAGAIR